MSEVSKSQFTYHKETYELVKNKSAVDTNWVVYTYTVNGRGPKVMEFTDAGYTGTQARHTAMHMIRMYNAGVDAGRTEYRNKIFEVING